MRDYKKNKIIYLASPYGFSEATADFLEKRIYNVLKYELHYEVINPFKIDEDVIVVKEDVIKNEYNNYLENVESKDKIKIKYEDFKLAFKNEKKIEKSDIILAILDGVDVDSGTASEIGFAFARGKKIYGYRGDKRKSGENKRVLINLQVQYWIHKSGGKIFTKIDDLKKFF